MAFTFRQLHLPGLILIQSDRHPDPRGHFVELYKESEFIKAGIRDHFVQENYSFSFKNVIRGLHYQLGPLAQGKLIRCIRGEIFDVAADVWPESPTFGMSEHVTLSEHNLDQLYIPPMYAHGFCVVSDMASVVYLCNAEYDPSAEKGVRWDDPRLNIPWPVDTPILSKRDMNNPLSQ